MGKSKVVGIEAVRKALRERVAEAGSASELARQWGLTRSHVSHAMGDGRPIPIGIVRRLEYVREVRYREVAPDGGQR